MNKEKIIKSLFFLVEETNLEDTWYVETPSGYKGYLPTKALKAFLKKLAKEII